MSSDQIDQACDLEQRQREAAIENVRYKAIPDTTYHSHCAWCKEPTKDGRKYCSYGRDSCHSDATRRDDVLKRTVGVNT